MAIADLTAQEYQVVEEMARVVRKDITIAFAEALSDRADQWDQWRQANATLLQDIASKLTDNSEELLGIKVGTIKRVVGNNLPSNAALWSAIKDVI